MIYIKKILISFFVIFLSVSLYCFYHYYNLYKNNYSEINFILDWFPNTNHTGLYVAKEKGYFDDEELKVNIHYPPQDSSMLLVASCKGQIGIGFQDSLSIAAANNIPLPITAIASILQHNTSGIISLKNNNINELSMLEGKTYITWNANLDTAILRYAFKINNKDINNVNIIENSSLDILTSLKKVGNAATAYYGWDGIALKTLYEEVNFIPFISIDKRLDFYSPIIIVNDKYLRDNSDSVNKFLKALSRGYEYASKNPNEAADILFNQVYEVDKRLLLESQKFLSSQYMLNSNTWGYIDEDRWNDFNLWLYENNVIGKKLPQNACLDNSYIKNFKMENK